MDKNKLANEMTKRFVDEGKLIEAGFAAMRVIALENANPAQIDDMRIAYMAGAEHLFRSIMAVLDPGEEPTRKDLMRMDLINDELERWRTVLAGYLAKGATQARG